MKAIVLLGLGLERSHKGSLLTLALTAPLSDEGLYDEERQVVPTENALVERIRTDGTRVVMASSSQRDEPETYTRLPTEEAKLEPDIIEATMTVGWVAPSI